MRGWRFTAGIHREVDRSTARRRAPWSRREPKEAPADRIAALAGACSQGRGRPAPFLRYNWPMATRPRRRVFISAAASDSAWARKLAERLRAADVDVWDPSTDALPGANYSAEVGKALDRAAALVVLISPAAVKSEWVRREIQHALGTERFRSRLIPVLVEPTPEDDVPWILRTLQWAKGTPARAAQQIIKLLETPGRPETRAKAR
jgi:hypothetical protein